MIYCYASEMMLTMASGRKMCEAVHGTPSNGVIC